MTNPNIDWRLDALKYEALMRKKMHEKLEAADEKRRKTTSSIVQQIIGNQATVRDHVAAALYPFAIDQSSRSPWTTEADRRKKLRTIAKICYMAADEFIAARNEIDHAP